VDQAEARAQVTGAVSPRPTSLHMVGAILAGCFAMLLAVSLVVLAFVSANGAGVAHALADLRDVIGIAIKQLGLAALALAFLFGILVHHVLYVRGRDAQAKWYAWTGALFGAIVAMASLWSDVKWDLGTMALVALVGAFLGTVYALAFGAAIRRGRRPTAVAPPPDPR